MSRRTIRAIASASANPTATAADVFVLWPEIVYVMPKATAGSAVSAMPSGPPVASAIVVGAARSLGNGHRTSTPAASASRYTASASPSRPGCRVNR